MIVGFILGGLGLVCLMLKRSLLGILLGVQLLFYGGAVSFVLAGISAETFNDMYRDGFLFGLFVLATGVAQLVIGFTAVTRLFYLKRTTRIDQVTTLRN